MLINGVKFEYKEKTGGNDFKALDVKSVPDIGADANPIENTALGDTAKRYENGIKDYGTLEYVLRAEGKTTADSTFMKMVGYQKNNTILTFKETYPDGLSIEFDGMVSIKRSGGEIDGVVEDTLSIQLQSDLNITAAV